MHRWLAMLLVSTGAMAPAVAMSAPAGGADNDVHLQADMDGDGLADRFAIERWGDKVLVSATLATGASSRLEFTTADLQCSVVVPDPACGDVPHGMKPLLLDPDTVLKLEFAFQLEDTDSFPSNGHASAIWMQQGDAPAYLFYWNPLPGKLEWYRLFAEQE